MLPHRRGMFSTSTIVMCHVRKYTQRNCPPPKPPGFLDTSSTFILGQSKIEGKKAGLEGTKMNTLAALKGSEDTLSTQRQ